MMMMMMMVVLMKDTYTYIYIYIERVVSTRVDTNVTMMGKQILPDMHREFIIIFIWFCLTIMTRRLIIVLYGVSASVCLLCGNASNVKQNEKYTTG